MTHEELLVLLADSSVSTITVEEAVLSIGANAPPTPSHIDELHAALGSRNGERLVLRTALLSCLNGESFLRFFYNTGNSGPQPGELTELLEVMASQQWAGKSPELLVRSLYRYTESEAGRWWLERQVGCVWDSGWSKPLLELADHVVKSRPARWWFPDSEREREQLLSPCLLPSGPFAGAAAELLSPLSSDVVRIACVLAADSEEPLPRLIAAAAALGS
jgi:hypothetical protein